MPKRDAKKVNIRLEPPLLEAVKEAALEQHRSLNSFVAESLTRAVEDQRRSRLRKAFAGLAKQHEDVDYSFVAQREVVLGGE